MRSALMYSPKAVASGRACRESITGPTLAEGPAMRAEPRWTTDKRAQRLVLVPLGNQSTKPRRSGGGARPSSSLRSNGSIGSTPSGSWSPSAKSRLPRPKPPTMQQGGTRQKSRLTQIKMPAANPGRFSYDRNALRDWLKSRGTEPVIPPRSKPHSSIAIRQEALSPTQPHRAQLRTAQGLPPHRQS